MLEPPSTASSARRSAKIPDPPVFSDGMDPTWETWNKAIREKLLVNEDYYPSSDAQIAYIYSRISGTAVEHLLSRRGTDDPDYFTNGL